MPKGVYLKTEKHKRKLSAALVGKPLSLERRLKISEAMKQYAQTKEGKYFYSKVFIGNSCKGGIGSPGHIVTEEHKRRISEANLSTKNGNYIHGQGYEPYTAEFYKMQEYIRERDSYTCQLCGVPEAECCRALDIHHIDYNKKNNCEFNLISLCNLCHQPTQTNRPYWTAHFTDLLTQEEARRREEIKEKVEQQQPTKTILPRR